MAPLVKALEAHPAARPARRRSGRRSRIMEPSFAEGGVISRGKGQLCSATGELASHEARSPRRPVPPGPVCC